MKKTFLIFSWCLYDLANQFFAINIISRYFAPWLITEKGMPDIFHFVAYGISMFFVTALAPILGYISDRAKRPKMLRQPTHQSRLTKQYQ